MSNTVILPDGSAFFVAEISDGPNLSEPIKWNPWNKVVQDHRDGTIDHMRTNEERVKRGLLVPWTPAMGNKEVHEPPIF